MAGIRVPVAPETRMRYALLIFGSVLFVGTVGYSMIEGWPFWDSLYMTVITLTTVGFGEVHPMSRLGQGFTVLLVLGGVGTATYTVFAATEFLVEKRMLKVLGRESMDTRLKGIKGHVIVCGFGRVGREICSEFDRRGVPFVVIERDEAKGRANIPYPVIFGDATEDATLREARIETAKSLVVALASESDNVFVVLSARQLNPGITITARGESPGMEQKLLRAGANRVVSPYQAGALRMAVTTLQPNVLDFMNIVAGGQSTGLRLEEVSIDAGSPFAERSLREIELRQRYGLMVVGIKHQGEETMFNPSSDQPIKAGDILLLIGPADNLEKLTAEAAGNSV